MEDARPTLRPLLGDGAAYAFGIALLASGLSSSAVGTMAGQMIVDGFMQWSVSVFLRRFITMIPALIVIGLGDEHADDAGRQPGGAVAGAAVRGGAAGLADATGAT